MTFKEAVLAVQTHAECEYGKIRYYAYSAEYVHPTRKKPQARMGLLEKKANCIMYAPMDAVTVVRWNIPEELVKKELGKEIFA